MQGYSKPQVNYPNFESPQLDFKKWVFCLVESFLYEAILHIMFCGSTYYGLSLSSGI